MLVLPLGGDDTRAMLDGLAHYRPLVNGDSGFIPRPFDRALELFGYGLSDEGLPGSFCFVGVLHVVALTEVTPEVVPGVTWPEGNARKVARFATERVAEVEAGEGAHVVEPVSPWRRASRKTRSSSALPEATISVASPSSSPMPSVALPRVEASLDGVGAVAGGPDPRQPLRRQPLRSPPDARPRRNPLHPAAGAFPRIDSLLPARAGPVPRDNRADSGANAGLRAIWTAATRPSG